MLYMNTVKVTRVNGSVDHFPLGKRSRPAGKRNRDSSTDNMPASKIWFYTSLPRAEGPREILWNQMSVSMIGSSRLRRLCYSPMVRKTRRAHEWKEWSIHLRRVAHEWYQEYGMLFRPAMTSTGWISPRIRWNTTWDIILTSLNFADSRLTVLCSGFCFPDRAWR